MPSRSHILAIFVALCLSLLSTNSFAADLFDMLKRMSEADQQQNYQGIFILRKSDKLSTMRVTHGIDDNDVWESLEALDGEPRKVVRHNDQVISIFPERKLVIVRRSDNKQSLHPKLPENIDQLDLFYTINRRENDRIANHQALVFDLIPKDQYRYGYQYWVDKNTGMLLRCDLISENRTVVEQMMFTSLEYLKEPPSQMFELQQFETFNQQVLDEPVVDAQYGADIAWTVNILPKGFVLTQNTMRYSRSAITDTNAPQENIQPDLLHMVYSDGLASVSVFVEKYQGDDKHLQGASTMGAVNAYGHSLGDYFVTVVGEVPLKTVQAMAQSISKVP